MPTIKLTREPNAVIPDYLMVNLWEMEIVAHSFYPDPGAGNERKKWVEKLYRTFAKDWTGKLSPLENSGDLHRRWFALHGLSQTKDEIGDLKHNENRDLKFAANILVDCTLGGMSKAGAINKIASKLMADSGANSANSAETTVKRAWRKYNTGCHYVAAWAMLYHEPRNESALKNDFLTFTVISFAEHLRELGEATIPKNGSVPILDANKTWKVPEWFPRTEISVLEWNDGSGIVQTEMTILEAAEASR